MVRTPYSSLNYRSKCALPGKPHFWSELILEHLFFITVLDNLRRFPLLVSIGKFTLPWAITAVRDKHTGYTRTQVQRFDELSPR